MFPVYIFLKDVCAVMASVLVFTVSALVDMCGLSVPLCPCLCVIRAMQRFVFCWGWGTGGPYCHRGPGKIDVCREKLSDETGECAGKRLQRKRVSLLGMCK